MRACASEKRGSVHVRNRGGRVANSTVIDRLHYTADKGSSKGGGADEACAFEPALTLQWKFNRQNKLCVIRGLSPLSVFSLMK